MIYEFCSILIPSIPERLPPPISPHPCSVRLLQELFKLFNIAICLDNEECDIFPRLIRLSKAALESGIIKYKF